jgi:hypothetical protein
MAKKNFNYENTEGETKNFIVLSFNSLASYGHQARV